MGIAERKQRAFEERERMVVEHADDLLMDRGYLGLNLDELAERVEYSKATLYHHFTSKEDLVLAVVTRHTHIRTDYFTRATRFQGNPRERMLAFGVADQLLSLQFPHGFPLVQLVRLPSIWSKCSEARQNDFFSSTGHCFELAMTVANDAVTGGDMEEWANHPEELVWGLVSLSKGAHLLSEEALFQDAGAEDRAPLEYLFDNYHRLLDGGGWRPYSRDYDYEASRKRIEEELFGDEFAAIQ